MRNFILATAAVVALSFASSTAMAEHYSQSYYRRSCAPQVTPYHAYRYSPAYSSRYHAYRSPYYRPSQIQSRYYGYPSYSRSNIGVHGRNFSFHIGF
ncbi:MAG: hypothetical protein H8E66_00805 [Planctomycetes bacterium]|nr:hypothetical protein [Planctomycetota bacterium]